MVKYCHRSIKDGNATPCLKEECSMWDVAEQECIEVFILYDKARKIWREEQ